MTSTRPRRGYSVAVPHVDDLIALIPDPFPGPQPELSAAQVAVIAGAWAELFVETHEIDRAERLFELYHDAITGKEDQG